MLPPMLPPVPPPELPPAPAELPALPVGPPSPALSGNRRNPPHPASTAEQTTKTVKFRQPLSSIRVTS